MVRADRLGAFLQGIVVQTQGAGYFAKGVISAKTHRIFPQCGRDGRVTLPFRTPLLKSLLNFFKPLSCAGGELLIHRLSSFVIDNRSYPPEQNFSRSLTGKTPEGENINAEKNATCLCRSDLAIREIGVYADNQNYAVKHVKHFFH